MLLEFEFNSFHCIGVSVIHYPASETACHARGLLDPIGETGLELGLCRECYMNHAHGVQRNVHACHYNLAIQGIQHLGQHIAQETVVGSLFLVETEYELAIVVLLHLVHDTMGKVGCETHFGEQRHADRCCNVCSLVKYLSSVILALLVLIEHHGDGREGDLAVLLAHKQSQVHKTVDHTWVCKCQKGLFGRYRLGSIECLARKDELARSPVGCY